jgi:hypothetical protein
MTWNDLTVGQYQRIYPIITSDISDESKLQQIVMELEGKECTAGNLERKIGEYAFLSQMDIKPKAMKRFNVGGRWYRFNYDIEKMPAARYVEIKTFMGGDFVNNMHMIMASAVVPIKRKWFRFVDTKYESNNHSFYAKDMQDANFIDCYNSLVFFYLRLAPLTKNSLPFMRKSHKMKKAMKKAQEILLQSITDGYSPQRRLPSLSA